MFYLSNSVFKLQMISMLDLSHRGIRNEFRAGLMIFFFLHGNAKKKKKTKQMKTKTGSPLVALDMPSPALRESIEDVDPQGH